MSIELALSIIALLVSALSAIYARRAASEAKRANSISSHQHKLAIFESVNNFIQVFQIHGEAVETTFFYSLLASADKASLYFTPSVADHLSKYAKAAHKVLIARDRAKHLAAINRDVPKEKWDEIFQLVDQCRAVEGSLLADLQPQTKIVD